MFTYLHKKHTITGSADNAVLTQLDNGQSGIIVSIAGGKVATKRLADLGLVPGTGVMMVRKALFSGPIQIEVCGSKLVLGRGLSSKIIVKLK